MKVSVFIAASLDGCIARKNGDIDWLMLADSQDEAENYGYEEFFDSVDCMVMGRNSLKAVLKLPDWPYEGKRVVVLSNTMNEPPEKVRDKVELYSGSINRLVEQLKSENCQRLYIDGGRTIQAFLREGLITDLAITRIPILLGEGLPLFGATGGDIKLRHLKTASYPSGFVTSTYEI